MNDLNSYSPKELAAALKIPYRIILDAINEKKLRVVTYKPRYRRIRSRDAANWIESLTK